MSALISPELCACPECDALQHRVALTPGYNAHCIRCGAVVARSSARTPQHMFPLVLGGLLVFIIANIFPIVSFQLLGAHRETNVLGAVLVFISEGWPALGILLFITAFFMPLLDITILLYLLWPRHAQHVLPGFARMLHALQVLRPWGMVEVFMLGVIVALTKLAHTAEIIPGVALWAYLALMFILPAILSYNLIHLWALHAPERTA